MLDDLQAGLLPALRHSIDCLSKPCQVHCPLPACHPSAPTFLLPSLRACPAWQEFLAYFDTTVDRETTATALAPNSLLYTSAVLATVQGRAFYEGTLAGDWGGDSLRGGLQWHVTGAAASHSICSGPDHPFLLQAWRRCFPALWCISRSARPCCSKVGMVGSLACRACMRIQTSSSSTSSTAHWSLCRAVSAADQAIHSGRKG